MSGIRKFHSAWGTAKWICMAYLLSLVAGWLSHQFVENKISPENKAALFILLATLLTIIGIFCTVGIRRWRKQELSSTEKRLLVFSLAMFVFMFVIGWFSKIG